MARSLRDQVVVITGASSGIGRATAREFTRRGARVVLAARREDALREAAAECGAHARTLVVPTDVTDEDAVKHLAQSAVKHFGHIDVWVNNAAVALFGRFEETQPTDFRRVIETNLFGCVNGARVAITHFRERGQGVLINIASQVARAGQPYTSAYSISKFAVRGLTESLRQELRGTNIEVCSVLPASTDTPLFQQAANCTGRAVQPMPPVMNVQRVARRIVGLAENPRHEVFVGNLGHVGALLHDVAPDLYARIIKRKVEKDHFQNEWTPATPGNLYEPMPQHASISGGWKARRFQRGMKTVVAALPFAAVGAAVLLLIRGRQHS